MHRVVLKTRNICKLRGSSHTHSLFHCRNEVNVDRNVCNFNICLEGLTKPLTVCITIGKKSATSIPMRHPQHPVAEDPEVVGDQEEAEEVEEEEALEEDVVVKLQLKRHLSLITSKKAESPARKV